MQSYRPKPFYYIDTTDPAELTREVCRHAMLKLRDAGFGGCVLFNKPPLGFDQKSYLSDFWFDTLENFILAGRELGLEMWINDGFDYPPGAAAGRIAERAPHLGQQRLRLCGDRVEVVDVPWGFPAFELPESSELFIEFVYEAYNKHLGRYFGDGIYGFFSDCDNRRNPAPCIGELEDGLYFPWSKNFASEFEKRKNYDIVPHLAAVLRGTDPDRQEDYWRVAGELYQQWFAANRAWCAAHGLKYTFHTSDTGPLSRRECRRSSLFSEGDPLALLDHSDFPGTDHEFALLDGGTHYDWRYRTPSHCWGHPERTGYQNFSDTRRDVRAKYAASAAFMKKAPRVMCEMFAASGFGTDPQELRRIAIWQIMSGVNFIIPHAAHHRFHGATKYFAPPNFMHETMRKGMREFNDFLAESCRIASDGEYCAAVAVLDPTPAVWRGDEAASDALFAICDRLNKSAVGYVIVTPEYLKAHRSEFALAVDPVNWDGRLDLDDLPGGDIRFSGGELYFMRRRRADGSEFLIACNIWNDSELAGDLVYRGKKYEFALAPGEYAVLGGEFERFRSPERSDTLLTLPMVAEAEFSSPQLIPLECPDRCDGDRREFVWRNRGDVGPLSLEWSEAFAGSILCDGAPVRPERSLRRFDDQCLGVTLPDSAARSGEHKLIFDGAWIKHTPPRLGGDVDVGLWTDRPSENLVRRFYNLEIRAPRRKVLELTPRRRRLFAGTSLGSQGQLFYDGETTFTWRFTLAEAASLIDLGDTRGICEVVLDVGEKVRSIFSPRLVPMRISAGDHELRITLYGSLGASLEGGNADVRLGRDIRICR